MVTTSTIINYLVTKNDSRWILSLENKDIKPRVIQYMLLLNQRFYKMVRFMDQYVDVLPKKMYLSALWSLLFFNKKKMDNTPHLSFPKKNRKYEKYDFILNLFKEQYKMSDKDFEVSKPFIIQDIENDKPKWFSYYGVDKKHWYENGLDYKMMKDYTDRSFQKAEVGLIKWL